jgi:hypothetical protein
VVTDRGVRALEGGTTKRDRARLGRRGWRPRQPRVRFAISACYSVRLDGGAGWLARGGRAPRRRLHRWLT